MYPVDFALILDDCIINCFLLTFAPKHIECGYSLDPPNNESHNLFLSKNKEKKTNTKEWHFNGRKITVCKRICFDEL